MAERHRLAASLAMKVRVPVRSAVFRATYSCPVEIIAATRVEISPRGLTDG